MSEKLTNIPEFHSPAEAAPTPASQPAPVAQSATVDLQYATAELITPKRDWLTPVLVGVMCLTLGMFAMKMLGGSHRPGPVAPSQIEDICEQEIKQWAVNKAAALRELARMTDAGQITNRSQYQANKRAQLREAMVAAVADNDRLENQTLPTDEWSRNNTQASDYMRAAADGYERAAQ